MALPPRPQPEVTADRLAEAVVARWLGAGHSLYNTVRDVLIEEFADERKDD